MTDDTLPDDDDGLRGRILADPARLLDDPEIMRALVEADAEAKGANVVDLRGLAMERLQSRLDRLEDTHRSVIAAAYENLAGTNQIHRAVLRMMDATRFETFLQDLSGEVADMLRVDVVRLVLETASPEDDPAIARLSDVLSVAEPGFVADYATQGRNVPVRQVSLRPVEPQEAGPYAPARPTSCQRPASSSISGRAACRACFCSVPRTRRASRRHRRPISWAFSPACSSGRCGAGCRDLTRAHRCDGPLARP
ncbi:hypothetical protein MBELCI_1329 [Limimaricola cinnabarinus LL-001]|uniref:Uncharacterized protein n=1 Tax=Limimaricola cinnabarinus LL-001 TaxID=1337093 RepID=U2Z2H8_9RHOB|nr:hypothetical protein MBELCI_1329 [Limimaricola cinnabarinus LL-001]